MLTRILNTAESFFGGQLPVDFHSKVAIKDKAKIQQDQSDITDKLQAKTNALISLGKTWLTKTRCLGNTSHNYFRKSSDGQTWMTRM